MKKIFLYIILLSILPSCDMSLLDREPLDKISENAVYSSGPLVDATLADLYARTQFRMPFDYGGGLLGVVIPFIGGEISFRGSWYGAVGWVNHSAVLTESNTQYLNYWAYGLVRSTNEFIGKLSEIEGVEGMGDDLRNVRIAEARFLRAFTYFEMVKRYGGVPLITEAQDIDLPEEKLFVSRNSEKEVYDFIADECDMISEILPNAEQAEAGRVHKYAALALKSRAMLYAASIAKYGKQQLDGLLGFPASEAKSYWQKAYDAAKAVQAGGYALYNEEEDKAKNYQMIFLDEGNCETIFSKVYNGKDVVGHSYSLFHWPGCDTRVSWGSEGLANLETVELYDYVDGRSGKDDRAIFKSDQLIDFVEHYKDKDPRFHASINYPGATFSGVKIYSHSGTYVDGVLDNSLTQVGEIDGEPWFAKSQWSRFQDVTGFGLKKFLDEPNGIQVKGGESDEDWIVFRYAETLLNLAEAAYELDKPGEALGYINEIRERAGMFLYKSIDMDKIRHERAVELFLEDQKFWDLKRWRTAETELSHQYGGIRTYFDWDAKKYRVEVNENADHRLRTFEEKHYYQPISISRISNNPNLAPENPGY